MSDNKFTAADAIATVSELLIPENDQEENQRELKSRLSLFFEEEDSCSSQIVDCSRFQVIRLDFWYGGTIEVRYSKKNKKILIEEAFIENDSLGKRYVLNSKEEKQLLDKIYHLLEEEEE